MRASNTAVDILVKEKNKAWKNALHSMSNKLQSTKKLLVCLTIFLLQASCHNCSRLVKMYVQNLPAAKLWKHFPHWYEIIVFLITESTLFS